MTAVPGRQSRTSADRPTVRSRPPAPAPSSSPPRSSARSPASPTRSSSATRALDDVVLLGIPTRGVDLARRLARAHRRASRAAPVPVGCLDVTMYRDDLRLRPARALERTDDPARRRRRQGRRPRRRRAVLRPDGPRRARRARRPRPPARRPARRPRRPRPPRAADPRRLRRQEPADLAAARPCEVLLAEHDGRDAVLLGDRGRADDREEPR